MHLKNITLRGFKSFASKTTLNLEPGITCIVGPNGSGKSNVVDALAWVMGEQGAKTLRGSKMDDVIFAGSDGKNTALGRAEVSLTIDNSDGTLPIEYSEVTITRTMFRGGGSEYKINDNTCRLLDIQELLSDTGLGKEMHVIVGQGRLDSILNASPFDRRAFIEEAAGVLKHRQRKDKALRKLEGMQSNLDRLNDLLSEVRRNLGPLGRQADVAKRANMIQINLRDSLARILADDYEQLLEHKSKDSERIAAAKAEFDKLKGVVELIEIEIGKKEVQLTNKQVQVISDKLHELNTLQEKYNALLQLSKQKQKHLTMSTLLFEGQDPKKLRSDAKEAFAKYESIQKEFSQAEAEIEKVRTSLNDKKHELQLSNSRYALLQKSSNDVQTEIARLETSIESFERDKTSQNDNIAQSATLNDSISKQIAEFEQSSINLQKDIDKQDSKLTTALKKMTEFEENLQSKQELLADITKDYNTIENDISNLAGQKQALEKMLEVQLGENVVLKNKKVSNEKTIAALRKIESPIMQISSEIGNDYVLASNSHIANQVAETNARLQVLNLDGELIYHEMNDGSEVKFEENTFSIREQIAIYENESSTKTKELKKCETAINSAQKAVEKAENTISDYKSEIKVIEDESNTLKQSKVLVDNQLHNAKQEIVRISNVIEKSKQNIGEIEANKKLAQNKIKDLQNNKDDSTALGELGDQIAGLDTAVQDLTEQYNSVSNNYTALKTQVAGAKIRATDLENQAIKEEEARERIKNEEAKREKLALKAQIVESICEKLIADLVVIVTGVKEQRQNLIDKQTTSSQELNDLRADLRKRQAELGSLSEQIHRYELDSTNIEGKISAIIDRIDHEVSLTPTELLKSFATTQEITIFAGYFDGFKKNDKNYALTPGTDENDAKKAQNAPKTVPYNRDEQIARFDRATRDIKALGKVNPLALEEFNALEERHKYLADQLQDLEKARSELLEMIKYIDERTISTFKSAFEDTSREFEKAFTVLFPGGKGRLVLTDPTDYLTTGIEVEATPAGKRISKLSLLSGGERSLVVIALLIAIFMARPSPFYVMDEVEAALDDVNLSRLLKIFKQLRENSQLLIVTHQKRTMEVADALYGITMRRDGITQVISQKL